MVMSKNRIYFNHLEMSLGRFSKDSKQPSRDPDVIWHCREYWNGDSKDGHLINGDGYHYFEMKGNGYILRALEFYETEDGEEKSTELPELVGLNWFQFFGFEDDEILEGIAAHEFFHVESLLKKT
jgi:hypothetical protein